MSKLPVIINDLDVFWRVRPPIPSEADAPLLVDPYAVLPGAIAPKCFEAVAGRRPQVFQARCCIQHIELTLCDALESSPLGRASIVPEQGLDAPVSETFDHVVIYDTYRVLSRVFSRRAWLGRGLA
jgi:hypothetical protein